MWLLFFFLGLLVNLASSYYTLLTASDLYSLFTFQTLPASFSGILLCLTWTTFFWSCCTLVFMVKSFLSYQSFFLHLFFLSLILQICLYISQDLFITYYLLPGAFEFHPTLIEWNSDYKQGLIFVLFLHPLVTVSLSTVGDRTNRFRRSVFAILTISGLIYFSHGAILLLASLWIMYHEVVLGYQLFQQVLHPSSNKNNF